uniref:(northern house mosquito) hypothetical protein n=1 Tax=Culex pipiens TaxID=7175 RepID=A0A8D8AQW6_CULPI
MAAATRDWEYLRPRPMPTRTTRPPRLPPVIIMDSLAAAAPRERLPAPRASMAMEDSQAPAFLHLLRMQTPTILSTVVAEDRHRQLMLNLLPLTRDILGSAFPDPVRVPTRLVKDLDRPLDPAQEWPPEIVSEDLVGVRQLPTHKRPP